MKSLVIGLSGTTNSGKTTLSGSLKNVLPHLKVLNMDDYYWEEEDSRHILLPEFNNYANWEKETAVDFKRLIADAKSWKKDAEKSDSEQSVLIIEGIMIFKQRELVDLCDLKYFVTLPKDECWNRRSQRHYLPPEPPGYFEAICWPEYLKHKEEVQALRDIVYVDGTVSCKELFRTIHQSIVSSLGTSSS